MVLPNVRKGNTIQVNLPIFSFFFMDFFSIVKFSYRELGTENEQQ